MKLEDRVRELAPSCRFTARYGGEESVVFWNAVRGSENRLLYVLGCALQDLEAQVLREVNADVVRQLREHLRKQRAERRKGRRGKKQTGKPIVSSRA